MQKISVSIAAGEGNRAKSLEKAIVDDPRFDMPRVDSEIPVDVQFRAQINPTFANIDELVAELDRPDIFNCELKECSDYISSVLGKDGHLYCQHMSMRESGHPAMILVLGNDLDVSNAIVESLEDRYKGKELAYQIGNYEARLQDFEAKSFANGIPVMRWKARPFSRLLSTAAQVLGNAEMTGYAPKPADKEREIVATSLLFRGIGPKTLEPVLKEYELALVPRGAYAKPIEEMPGWGPKRCKQIASKVRMIYR
jgi:ERCC4-type nuclease